ncbi:MAG: hypothetical protein AABP62_04225 [Planctomycetota bacterium]
MTPPTAIIGVIVALGLALAWRAILRARRAVRATTLPAAWLWSVSALALWTVSWVSDHGLRVASSSVADHLWYASAVLALCPPIAVLGSRRPGTRVWTWFIQFPLLLVLGWPVLSLWLQGSEVRGLQLETPQLVAFVLVLIMGAGNYCGTRFTLPILGYAAACGILAVSSSVSCPDWLADRWWARQWATGLLAMAMILAGRTGSRGSRTTSRFDRLWLDFFDAFGVVWGRRIQDRVNFIAQKEQWPARLELHGFVWTDTPADSSDRAAIEARIEHTFRWLLRRFVDPSWIDERIGPPQTTGEIRSLAADS